MSGKILSAVLIFTILGAIGAMGYMFASPKVVDRYTEFYMLGPNGNAQNYPWDLKLGQEGVVILDITNHEYQTMGYRVEITVGTTLIETLGPIELADGSEWKEEVGFKPPDLGPYQQVEFKLFKIRELGEVDNRHTELSLWLGQQELSMGVVNDGFGNATYNVEVGAQDGNEQKTVIAAAGPAVLAPGANWKQDLSYSSANVGKQQLEFSLYKDGALLYKEEILGDYPELYLWINVQ